MFTKCVQFSFFLGLLGSVLAMETISKDGLFTKIGNGYYLIEHNLTKNWYQAYESCRRIGANLITIDTMEEWNAINKYLKDMNIEQMYWTSGTDLGKTGEHIWFSNGQPITLDIWAPGQPDNAEGLEHCDMLGWVRSTTPEVAPGLNDAGCEQAHSYICEASPLKAPAIVNIFNNVHC